MTVANNIFGYLPNITALRTIIINVFKFNESKTKKGMKMHSF